MRNTTDLEIEIGQLRAEIQRLQNENDDLRKLMARGRFNERYGEVKTNIEYR